jgi:hypothetical protein
MFDIAQHRDEILKRWIDLVVDGYPEETAKFLRSKSDQFANPVGAGLHEGLADLLDGLINGVDAVDLGPALDRVIRVRAVQEFAPSEAVKFVFDLKDLLFDIAGDEDRDPVADEIASRIEAAGLYAFDVYMNCREEMWSIRTQEVRNQSIGIMERVAAWKERREEKPEDVPQS